MKFKNLYLLACGSKVSYQGVYDGRLQVDNKIQLGNWRVHVSSRHRWGGSVQIDLKETA
jgi:hypothetical protein